MKVDIGIKSWGSISPLGFNKTDILEAYSKDEAYFHRLESNGEWVSSLSDKTEQKLTEFIGADKLYRKCDKTVQMALWAAKEALKEAHWDDKGAGVFIGSSRGAAKVLEDNHQSFLENKPIELLTSPLTTMGNISAIVARYLQLHGFTDTISMTCSSGFHSLLQGISWIKAGMKDKMLVGGTEAPLTPFFIQQLKELKLYSSEKDNYPNRSLDFEKKRNSMILGEGTAVFAIEKRRGEQEYKGVITGIGYGMENASNLAAVSKEGDNVQLAMSEALKDHHSDSIDVIIMHAPGTVKGDVSEKKAIQSVFKEHKPMLTSNKWKVGHSLGASGALSLEMALLMLQEDRIFQVPFVYSATTKVPKKIMVNTLGFGGNAISIIIEKA